MEGIPGLGLLVDEVRRTAAQMRETDRRIKEINEAADRRAEETDRRIKEINEAADRRAKEIDRRIKEINEAADRRAKEADQRAKEIDRRIKEINEAAQRRTEETDRQLRETAQQLRKTDLQLKKLGKQIGSIGSRLGEFVEGMIKPGLVRMFSERGLEIDHLSQDVEAKRDGLATQIDFIAASQAEVIAVEVKSKLDIGDVNDHGERLKKFKFLLPHYKDYKLLGAVTAMVIPDDVARYAEKRGMFLIGLRGDMIELINQEGFTPKEW